MIDLAGLFAAFMAGLLGSAHCFGMCGGIASALQLAVPRHSSSAKFYLINYNLGRIFGYTLLGVIAGVVSVSAIKTFGLKSALNGLRIFSAIFLILMAGYIGRWWMLLAKFEKAGQHIFNPMKNLSKKLLPLKNPWQALLLGTLWGFLPCGLVYSALAYSASSSNIAEAALRMTFFGLGTFPAVGLMGGAATTVKLYLQKNSVKQLAAISMLIIALWTVLPLIKQLLGMGMHQH
ncbi:MAG TPA: sulfite exporter TauE/SafE family protein [Aeromonadales bacterium]|nr:sulfite exporter TauE/SafE family protein [Aeromonadales bacterium]